MAFVQKIDPSDYIGTFPIKNAEAISEGDLTGVDSNGDALPADMNAATPVEAKGFAYFAGTYPGRTSATGTSVRADSPRVSIYREGKLGGFSSLTIQGRVYLSGTAGGYTQTQPSTANDLIQEVGWATSATEVEVMVRPAVLKKQNAGTSTATLY